MDTTSYNVEKRRQFSVRHLFFPSFLAFVSETIIALMALIVFNAHQLSNLLFNATQETSDPVSFSGSLLHELWDNYERNYIVQQVSIFLLWAVVGTLAYVLLFRLFQITFGVGSSVGAGVQMVRKEHGSGLMHWLGTLHDFFLKALVIFAACLAFILGAFVCFGVASQELRIGLVYEFPASLQALALSFLAALLSIRFIVLSLSLVFPRFRNWYTSI